MACCYRPLAASICTVVQRQRRCAAKKNSSENRGQNSRTTLGPRANVLARRPGTAIKIGGAGQASSRRSRVVFVLLWKHGRGRIAEAPAGVSIKQYTMNESQTEL